MGHRGIRIAGLVFAFFLVALAPASAGAEEITLTPAGCVKDAGSPAACAVTSQGLGDPSAVAISPDGASVYVAATADDAVAVFDRAADGSLTPAGCIGDAGTTICGTGSADRQQGLDGVVDLAVSQDGRHVFAVSPTEDTIVHLRRNLTSGALTPAGCFDDPSGADLCFFQIAGLDGARTVASVDPPGGSAWAFVGASGIDDTLLRFPVDANNIIEGDCMFSDPDAQLAGCAAAEGLGGIEDIAVSPDADGESLYAIGKDDDAIARFDQDGVAFDYAGCIADPESGDPGCAATAQGLEGPRGVEVSPDGDQVFVAALTSSSLVQFNRDDRGLTGTPDGALSPIGCINDSGAGAECAASAPGLNSAFSVASSPDGGSVYVASVGGALVSFDRPSPTGLLDPIGCFEADGAGAGCGATAPGLGLNLGLAVSPDGTSVYVTSSSGDTLAAFRRGPAVSPPAPEGPATQPDVPPAAPRQTRPPPSGRLRVIGVKLNRRRGTASLKLSAPAAGLLRARGRHLRNTRCRARAAGTVRIVVRPDRRGRRTLARKGALRVRVRLELASGEAQTTWTATKRLRLALRAPARRR